MGIELDTDEIEIEDYIAVSDDFIEGLLYVGVGPSWVAMDEEEVKDFIALLNSRLESRQSSGNITLH